MFMTVSDVHSNLCAVKSAIEYAKDHNIKVIFLGDLIDSGEHPIEVSNMVLEDIQTRGSLMTIGNHDYKHYRFLKNNPVQLNKDQEQTHSICGELLDEFLATMGRIIEHPNTKFIHRIGDIYMAHASISAKYWDDEKITQSIKSKCMYGHVDSNVIDEKGYKKRTYCWADSVPKDKVVIVGHDRAAMKKEHTEVKEYVNSNGGKVIFSDTSCNKSPGGYITGVLFEKNSIVGYKKFI